MSWNAKTIMGRVFTNWLPWPSPSHNKCRNVDINIFREANHRIFVFLSLDKQVSCFENIKENLHPFLIYMDK